MFVKKTEGFKRLTFMRFFKIYLKMYDGNFENVFIFQTLPIHKDTKIVQNRITI